MSTIHSFALHEDSKNNRVTVIINIDGEDKIFDSVWLRDHCRCEQCYHTKANQRLVDTHVLDPQIESIAINGNRSNVAINWRQQSHTSNYHADFLAAVTAPDIQYDVMGDDQITWNANNIEQQSINRRTQVAYKDLIADSDCLFQLLENIRLYGFCFVHHVPTDLASTRKAMERISYIRSSIFGDVWTFSSNNQLDDTAYTPLEIKPHTDGSYNHDAPGILGLHCLEYNATGGESILVDGFHLANQLRRCSPETYRVLSQHEIAGQYLGDGVHLVAQRPLFRHNQNGQLVQVTYNNHDRAPFLLPLEQLQPLYDALSVFDKLTQASANQFVFSLKPGTLLLFNNWRLLHGRLAFTGHRSMVGGYLNYEDFESKLRLLS